MSGGRSSRQPGWPLQVCALVVGLALGGTAAAEPLAWPGRAAAFAERIEGARDADIRAVLVRDLQQLSAGEAAPLLSLYLADPEPSVRASACTAIGASRAPVSLQRLAAALSDRSEAVRRACATALGALADEASVDGLARTLADRAPSVRASAARALGRIGSPEAVASLLVALQDPHRDVVVAALAGFADAGDPSAVYAVLERVDDPSAAVALAAVQALATLGAPEGIPSLVRVARTGAPEAASAAFDALRAMRAAEGLPAAIAEVLSPRGEQSLTAASMLLTALADPRALHRVAPLLRSHPERLTGYMEAIGAAGWVALGDAWRAAPEDASMGLARLWLRSGDPEAVAAVVVAFGTEDADALYALLRESPSADAVCAAATALPGGAAAVSPSSWFDWASEVGGLPCMEPRLSGAETWPNEERHSVAAALARGGSPSLSRFVARHVSADTLSADDAGALARALVDADEGALVVPWLGAADPRVRARAALALAQTAEPQVIGALARLPDRPETVRALRGLWASSEAAALVGRYLGSSDPSVRAAAVTVAAASCAPVPPPPEQPVGFALRRAYAEHAERCASPLPAAGAFDDPVLTLAGLRHASEETLTRVVADPDEAPDVRVGALQRLARLAPEHEQLRQARGAEAPIVVAAALSVGELDDAQRAASMARFDHAVVRAVLFARGSSEALSAERAQRLLTGQPFGAPLEISVVEPGTGAPRVDAIVVGVTCSGEISVVRSDALGSARFPRDVQDRVCFVTVEPS